MTCLENTYDYHGRLVGPFIATLFPLTCCCRRRRIAMLLWLWLLLILLVVCSTTTSGAIEHITKIKSVKVHGTFHNLLQRQQQKKNCNCLLKSHKV